MGLWERIRGLGSSGGGGDDPPPVDEATLKEEIGAATTTGIRSAVSDHPAHGLTPVRLAAVLLEAEQGDPSRQCELAEDVEEKYLHYQSVLGTRRRQVTQLEIRVEAAGDDAASVRDADLVRDFLDRDTLQAELFDILDAIGKGYSGTEIVWDHADGLWMPARLEWRDPRWFRFDPTDYETPRLLGEAGRLLPLQPAKWIWHEHRAKSGLPGRGGLIRGVAWWYLFVNYDVRDWVEFLERFGQPIRIGRYGKGATPAEKSTLLRAVRNLAADAGAIIPEGMLLELIEAKVSGSVDAFERFARYADAAVSKAVLGQTGTTDVGQHVGTADAHENVREDIERADAGMLAATLNRDLVRPLVALNHGPRKRYPRLFIGRPDTTDVALMLDGLRALVPMGLRVSAAEVRDKIGLEDPDGDEELLRLPQSPSSTAVEGGLKGSGEAVDGAEGAEAADAAAARPEPFGGEGRQSSDAGGTPGGEGRQGDAIERLSDAEAAGWERLLDPAISAIAELAAGCASAEEFLERLPGLADTLPVDALTESLARSLFVARAAGAAGADIGNGGADGD